MHMYAYVCIGTGYGTWLDMHFHGCAHMDVFIKRKLLDHSSLSLFLTVAYIEILRNQ